MKTKTILNCILLIVFAFIIYCCVSCTKEDECETCTAEFINVNTGETIHAEADCDRVPPESGFVFVKCIDNPDY